MLELTDFGELQFREEDFKDKPSVNIDGISISDTLPEKWEKLMRFNSKVRELWESTNYSPPTYTASHHAYALQNAAGSLGLDISEAAALNVAHYARLGRKEKGERTVANNLKAWREGRERLENLEASRGNGQPLEREPGESMREVAFGKGDPAQASINAAAQGAAIGDEFQDLTQLWSAGRFVSDHRDDVLWCQRQRSWHLWTGKEWRNDDVIDIQVKAKDTITRLMHEAVKIKDHKEQAAHLQFAMRLQRRDQMDAMLGLAKPYVPARVSDFDRDPMLFNCANGTLDLRTGALREHRREDMITKMSPAKYDPAAPSPLFDRFLDRIMAGDHDRIRYLQKVFGYAMTGDVREDLFVVFYGKEGQNGKNTLVNAVRDVMGNYARIAAPKLFIYTKNETHPAEVADLFGARLVIVGETDQGQRLNAARIKAHTGKDRLKARNFYQDFFEFDPTHKIVWMTNHKPVIRDTTFAMWRRVRLIPFTVRIPERERDLTLGEKLKAEASGILRWLVEGCLLWQKQGLESPEAVKTATEDYRVESDSIGRFLEERCVLSTYASIKKADLYAAFVRWSEEDGDKYPMGNREFAVRLREKGLDDGASTGERTWKGVALNPQE